ncbi:GGDEF domain-containing protein [Glaciecola sp. KUL10]|uniref:GGDEF domain-containing protein n=1 Tax=Glaciecola sp. (strain KUL10) TaxID=2161813 RepID=UPI00131417A0|nr:GGDEF domain-containing protein [Glaciecola sp. KUL10]
MSINIYLSAPLFGDISLTWGNTMVMLALLTQRFPSALLACLVNSVGLAAFAELPYAGLLSMIEFCVLAVLQYHRVYLLLSSIFFWLCIGMPLTWFAIKVFELPFEAYALIYTAKEALAGLMCAALACLVYFTLPAKLIATREQQKEHKLATNIFSLSAMTLILPTLVISLLLTRYSTLKNEEQLINNTQEKAVSYALLTEQIIDENKAVLEQVAVLAQLFDKPEDKQVVIESALARNSLFSDIIFSELEDLDISEQVKERLKRNAYMQNTDMLSSHKDIYGSAHQAIHFFKPRPNTDEEFVVAALKLDDLASYYLRSAETQDLIVTDNQRQIVYASSALSLPLLTRFSPTAMPSVLTDKLLITRLQNNEYAVSESTNAYGWTAYVLTPSEDIGAMFSGQITRLGVSLLVTILIFLLIAHRLSQKMAMPLVNLIEQSGDSPISTFEPLVGANIESSSEIKAVATRLRKSHVLLRDFEQQLQLQVTEKTEELEQLNLILAAQAREDGLTQLLNRSGFDELANNAIKTNQRMKQPISLALVDIDKFKVINDTYGHPVGDECLKAFAGLMQSHCKRETDIIGRYGGEEFVILMSGKDVISHHQLIQNIHIDTQYLEVTVTNLPKPIKFTVSIGVCSLLADSMMNLAEIIQVADEELYKCKNNGRNQMSIVTIEATE